VSGDFDNAAWPTLICRLRGRDLDSNPAAGRLDGLLRPAVRGLTAKKRAELGDPGRTQVDLPPLAAGKPSSEQIAQMLDFNLRTLQRRLAEEQTSAESPPAISWEWE
jgi:hypothetical protein